MVALSRSLTLLYIVMKSEWFNFEFIVKELGGKRYHTEGRERARMMVRIRDEFTCQACGAVRTIREVTSYNAKFPGKMKLFDVHHLNGACGSNSKGYDKTDNISGLITLCHSCHYNHHEFSKRMSDGKKVMKLAAVTRAQTMAKLLAEGKTLREIGIVHNITGERARQIMAKIGVHPVRKQRRIYNLICKKCGSIFKTYRIEQRFCDMACKKAYGPTPEERRLKRNARARRWNIQHRNDPRYIEATRRRNNGEKGFSYKDIVKV